ncbi:hypothetical protein ABPG77_003795 [Micractinium sp. CCAP 211/92]
MAAHTDMALLWAFDRLIDCDPERLPNKTLVDTLLPLVAGSPLELPDQVQARLVLRMLEADLAEGRVDDDTLDYLLTLAACELDSVDAAFLAPLPALILAVKTELALQTFRPGTAAPTAEAHAQVDRLFAGAASEEEVTRLGRLHAALGNPKVAKALQAEFPFTRVYTALNKFVARARVAVPSLLKPIEDDINAGRYEPGVGALPGPPAPLAGLASPRRVAAPAPALAPRVPASPGIAAAPAPSAAAGAAAAGLHDLADLAVGGADMADGYESPPPAQQQQQQQQQQRSAGRGRAAGEHPAVVQQLHARLGSLAQQGREDPLPAALGDAAAAAAAAAAAPPLVAGGGGGRAVMWEESPAVKGAMPELQHEQYARAPPLVAPGSASRPAGRRAVVAPLGSEDAQAGVAADGQRRRPKRWSDEEEAELVRLVKLHGRGSWALIEKEGADMFQGRRKQVDLKDKWRNIVKAGRINEREEAEIEEVEARLRQQLIGAAKRKPGRPPKFASPSAKRRRARADDSDEEEEEEDPVEDAGRGLRCRPRCFCCIARVWLHQPPGCLWSVLVGMAAVRWTVCGGQAGSIRLPPSRSSGSLSLVAPQRTPPADAAATEDEDEEGDSGQEEERSEDEAEEEGNEEEEGQRVSRKGGAQPHKQRNKGGRGGGRGGRGGGRGGRGSHQGKDGGHRGHEHDGEGAAQHGDNQAAGPRRSGRKHH